LSTPDDKNVAGSQVGMQSGGMARKTEKTGKETGSAVQVGGKEVPSIRSSDYVKKNGPDPKTVSPSDWAKVLDAASLGLPLERLWALSGMSDKTFTKYLSRFPEKAKEIEGARSRGEYDLTSVVRSCGPGWQGSAWLLERTRGYVARAQLEHTGKNGKELSISGSLLGAFGGSK
jgi:hypothetical protein